ncbi:hypothetical protein ACRB8Q_001329 [Escherichia coli]
MSASVAEAIALINLPHSGGGQPVTCSLTVQAQGAKFLAARVFNLRPELHSFVDAGETAVVLFSVIVVPAKTPRALMQANASQRVVALELMNASVLSSG